MDTIANMLTMLKNGSLVNKATIRLPHSGLKFSIANLLKEEGYIKAVHVEGDTKKVLELVLDYKEGSPRIKGVKRLSKPSKRVYMGVNDITPVRYGHGLLVLSTPKGVMSGKMARKEQVGGEPLFTIW
jgi:small subunit ribosomal protein S8